MSTATPPLTIGVYDLHASPRPLVDVTLFRPGFGFLGSEEAYHKHHESGSVIETSHFRVRPLTRELRRNHFWKRYNDVQPAPGERFLRWKLQLPLVCRPKSLDLRLTVPTLKLDVPVRAGVLLWPFGWSSHLEMRVAQPLTLGELRLLTQSLRESGAQPFQLNAAPTRLSDVFKSLSEKLSSDLYLKPIPDRVIKSRQLVMTIPSLDPPAGAHAYGDGMDLPRFSDRVRADLHAALLGQDISIPDVVDREKNRKFLVTPLYGAGFALTYFDKGTLIYLGQAAATQKQRSTLGRCLAANILTCSAVVDALSAARNLGLGGVGEVAVLKELSATAGAALYGLPYRYNSPFCQRLFETRSDLASLP